MNILVRAITQIIGTFLPIYANATGFNGIRQTQLSGDIKRYILHKFVQNYLFFVFKMGNEQ